MAVVDTHVTLPVVPAPQPVPHSQPKASAQAFASRIVHAQSEDGLLTWSYTSGLCEAFSHPEFLLTGLDTFLAESVLNQLMDLVAQGHVFTESSMERDLLHRLTCAFREVPEAMASILMPVVHNRQTGHEVSVLQCIYPDNKNRLPWHFGYNNSWHEVQPIFNFEAPLTKVEINLLQAAAGIHASPAQHRVAEL
jgi:hypothetical protein